MALPGNVTTTVSYGPYPQCRDSRTGRLENPYGGPAEGSVELTVLP